MGNLITFSFVLYECKQKLDQFEKAAIVQQGPPQVDEKFHGIFNLPLLDGAHTFQSVSLYAFLLGSVSGLGFSCYFSQYSFAVFGVYLFSLGLFHNLEYISTALYRDDVGLKGTLYLRYPNNRTSLSH